MSCPVNTSTLQLGCTDIVHHLTAMLEQDACSSQLAERVIAGHIELSHLLHVYQQEAACSKALTRPFRGVIWHTVSIVTAASVCASCCQHIIKLSPES